MDVHECTQLFRAKLESRQRMHMLSRKLGNLHSYAVVPFVNFMTGCQGPRVGIVDMSRGHHAELKRLLPLWHQ